MDTGYPDGCLPKTDGVGGTVGSNIKPFPWSDGDLDQQIEILLNEIKKQPEAESICQEAHRLVNGERDQSYGTALQNFTRIGKLWSVVLGIDISAEQVGLCMALLKFARELNKHKRDNLTDACGYLLCVQKVIEEREKTK